MTGSDKFTFLSCKRAVVYKEVHGDGRLRKSSGTEWTRVISCTECISNVDICNTGDRNDGSDGSTLDFNLVQAVKFVELADLYALVFVGS